MVAHGFVARESTTHLTLVGQIGDAGRTLPAGRFVDKVVESKLDEGDCVKLMCFGNSEEQPPKDRVSAEVAIRLAEAALATYKLVSVDGLRAAGR